jgi:uncharacterized protein YpmS
MRKSFFTKKEEETYWGWVFTIFLAFIFLIGLFFQHCIFVWPIRWDFATCAKEQWPFAVEKAVKFPSPN